MPGSVRVWYRRPGEAIAWWTSQTVHLTLVDTGSHMKALAGLATVMVLMTVSPLGCAEDTPESAVEQAARNWLGLVDAGDYAQSWVMSADYFQSSIEGWQWVARVSEVRRSVGALKRRTVSSVTFGHSAADGPDGEHSVIQFATRFRNKPAATETLALMKDPDGRWRVSGYYIK
jgi:hypothetical protein